MNDLKSALSSQYGVTAELLDLQLLRGVGGFFCVIGTGYCTVQVVCEMLRIRPMHAPAYSWPCYR